MLTALNCTGGEHVERQHRRRPAGMPGPVPLDQRRRPRPRPRRRPRRPPAERVAGRVGRLDQRVGDPGQGQGGQGRAGDVELRRDAMGSRVSGTCRIVTASTATASGRFRRKTQRQPPAWTSQPPSSGPDGPGHAAEAGPGAHGAGPVLGDEGGLDDGQRARREQRSPDALQDPRADQHPDAGREPAQGRGQREPDHADEEHLAAAQPVAERAAEQDEPGQRQRVPADRPLQAAQRSARQAPADGRQRDVHDGGVEQGHAGAQHRGQQDPAAAGLAQPERRRGRVRFAVMSRSSHRPARLAGSRRRAVTLPVQPDGPRAGDLLGRRGRPGTAAGAPRPPARRRPAAPG